ncbi:alanine racemase [Marinobacter fuscus]|uniref:Alanine racemase n=1 Tax=Marinobacter fuscus TaxID=2109942 RepID=A0A2T1KKL1_9GAMM|nr:alanine racemase [Marinobacter fuscus]PSF10560.1 alanine racemase [Marinobacter fuscus]
MPRSTVAIIHPDAIRYNFLKAKELAGAATVMAVVKADGYGHGIEAATDALAAETTRFAVACLEEARAIRQAGHRHTIALLQGTHESVDLAECQESGFEPVLHNRLQLSWLAPGQCPKFWLKVNTGMNRLGFRPDELPGVMTELGLAGFASQMVGFVTHFACADDADSDRTEQQTALFEEAVAAWPDLLRSVGNSAAHFRRGQPLFDLSRPGIMLYGGSPMIGKTGADLGLKPAMTLQAPLITTRVLQAGDAVGYGAGWVASRETRMGMVAIGYADGYPRHAGTDTPAAVLGRRIRLIGRVSMDMLAVDLSNAPEAREGDMVELWGSTVCVDEVAACAGTIGYELLTGVTARVPRVRG